MTISAVANMECRTALAALIGNFKDKDEELIVAQRRSQQPEDEKTLWSFATKRDLEHACLHMVNVCAENHGDTGGWHSQ